MTTFAFVDPTVIVNGVDLSVWVRSASISTSADELDNTAAKAAGGYRSRIAGLKDWTITLEFNSDFDASAVDATLWPLLGTNVTVSVNPTDGATSATNPRYSGPVVVSQVNPVGNSIGELATVSVTWSGAGALNRLTS